MQTPIWLVVVNWLNRNLCAASRVKGIVAKDVIGSDNPGRGVGVRDKLDDLSIKRYKPAF